MNCKNCNSSKMVRRGNKIRKGRKVTIFQCKKCKRYSTVNDETLSPYRHRTARILLLDIETSLMKFYSFGPKTEYLTHDLMIMDWSVLCWGAKWLFENEIMGEVVTPKEAIAREDGSILGGIWKLMDEAQIIITQNGINFDLKKLNSRFLLNGYPPPSQYRNVDTLKVSREVFGWSYNRLDFLGQKFGIGKKTDMEIEDWIQCSEGNPDYLSKMFEYCKRDVAPLLEDVYLHMLPWVPNHPNLNLYTDHDADACPKCESQDLKWGEKYTTPQGMWEGFRCQSCGAIGRGKDKTHNMKTVAVVT